MSVSSTSQTSYPSSLSSSLPPPGRSSSQTQAIIAIAVAVFVAIIVFLGYFLFYDWRRKERIKTERRVRREERKRNRSGTQGSENVLTDQQSSLDFPAAASAEKSGLPSGDIDGVKQPFTDSEIIRFSKKKDQIDSDDEQNGKADITVSVTLSNSQNKTICIPGYLKVSLERGFVQKDKLGKGGQAYVYSAQVISNSFKKRHNVDMVAIKYSDFATNRDEFRFEIAVMGSIPDHPNILKFFGYFESPVHGMIVELCTGPLTNLILLKKSKIDFTPDLMAQAAKQIAQGCQHIHSYAIVHFDLKPDNILYTFSEVDGYIFKIGDFGFAKVIDLSDLSLIRGLFTPKGLGHTFRYSSPEMLNPSQIFEQITTEHLKCDIYSYGIILYEILNGIKAWGDDDYDSIMTKLMAGTRPPIIDRYRRSGNLQSSSSKDLIVDTLKRIVELCWCQSPSERPSFVDILSSLSVL